MISIREAATVRAARLAAPGDRPSERRGGLEERSGRGLPEVRSPYAGLQIRAESIASGTAEFNGYATITDTPYQMYDMFGPYNEVVARDAIARALASEPSVQLVMNHGGAAFAATYANTLRLSAEEVADGDYAGRMALAVDADLDMRRSDVANVVYALDRGDLEEMSFKFRITAGEWSPDFETYTISEFDINRGDVSVVNYGANPHTSAALRSTPSLLTDAEVLAEVERRGLVPPAEVEEFRPALPAVRGQRGLTAAQADALAADPLG